MGLSGKLGRLNDDSSKQVQSAHKPITEAGFNADNIPKMQRPTPITHSEKEDIRKVIYEAQNDPKTGYIGREFNKFNLVEPKVPVGPEYPCTEVSSMIVKKMWRIVCIKKLHAFYTQDQLQTLVNRACRHDWRSLMKMWNIPTLDMTADLAVLGLYDIILFITLSIANASAISWNNDGTCIIIVSIKYSNYFIIFKKVR